VSTATAAASTITNVDNRADRINTTQAPLRAAQNWWTSVVGNLNITITSLSLARGQMKL